MLKFIRQQIWDKFLLKIIMVQITLLQISQPNDHNQSIRFIYVYIHIYADIFSYSYKHLHVYMYIFNNIHMYHIYI